MKRKRIVRRGFAKRNDKFVERTVIAMIGGGKPTKILSEVIHGYYRSIYHHANANEQIETDMIPPIHDGMFIDPSDFSIHYLKRNR